MIEIVADGAPAQEVEVGGPGATPVAGALPVLPLRDTVPVPDTMIPLAIGQERSIKLVDDVLAGDRRLVLVASREPDVEIPGPDQLYTVGVVGQVARMLKVPDGTLRLLVQGAQRVRIHDYEQTEPYLVAHTEDAPDEGVSDPPTAELTALQRNVQETFSRIVEAVPYLPEELQLAVANIDDPIALSHLIAGSLRLGSSEKQRLLEETDLGTRLRHLVEILARELEVISIGSQIQSQVQSELEKGQREYVLRQQLKAIQEELGESDPQEAEVGELREQLDALDLPEQVAKQADRELRRLESIPQASAEHGVIRTYLEWIVSLPWSDRTIDDLDLVHARSVLDADHFGLDKVKERILEFLAVRQLKPDARGSILCFVGPPGVGKTSLGRSIARAMGRNFERISAGGVRDEAEIRGHRRTYIGAMPGTIIRALRDAGSNNPLLMIDEIDKMGSDYRGDPSSAMLEVLDPEQNSSFRDHYLDVPFDLSRVMFITTANTLDTVPGPLRDRMEVIQLAGYTAQEKLEIAKRYLVPRQLDRHGLRRSWLTFGDPALRALIDDYTREAGVRNLEREIGRVVRKIAREIVEADQGPASSNGKATKKKGAKKAVQRRTTVSRSRVEELLGRPPFHQELRKRTSRPGVATGLAWTPVGGDVLFVEAAAMPGKGRLTTTGQLGDVMTESVRAALTWVRGHLDLVAPELPPDWFAEHDLHVHVPAGATPKDGPSAGITIATAISSLLSGREVRADVAMTGEITLTGEVLPIGGLKEKALAAQRNGVARVIAPRENERDADDVPEALRSRIAFTWVDQVEEVLEVALAPVSRRRGSGTGNAR
ncbi:ATP-dependent protease La [Patulibacter medicamentivorans]|uniref:Lon protease n=1 Tax=Patulibacter medicamentivorans TaxID=1097667 RepID=H0E461_9ACTN|nr:endopeptidase La [Patulibacter medicamentivorans]EHN11528.1 ATP-dependent protease La [Patulibacter medicamentivorans]